MRAHDKLPPEGPPAAPVSGNGLPAETPTGVA
jgi:hypothetical protein